jgi:hypothetical protein
VLNDLSARLLFMTDSASGIPPSMVEIQRLDPKPGTSPHCASSLTISKELDQPTDLRVPVAPRQIAVDDPRRWANAAATWAPLATDGVAYAPRGARCSADQQPSARHQRC